MKYLVFIVLLLASCTQIVERRIETITRETINDVVQTSVNQRVFPVPEALSSVPELSTISKSVQGDTDFENGIMYVDNAYQTDGLIHTLDLSSIVGNNQVLVALLFRHTAGCDNEYGQYRIKPAGMMVNYLTASVYLNTKEDIVYVMTDANGCLEWYSEYSWPYEKYAVMEIIALWYSTGVKIENAQ